MPIMPAIVPGKQSLMLSRYIRNGKKKKGASLKERTRKSKKGQSSGRARIDKGATELRHASPVEMHGGNKSKSSLVLGSHGGRPRT